MEQKPIVAIKGNTDEFLEHIAELKGTSSKDEQLLKLIKYAHIRMHEQAEKHLATLPTVKRMELQGLSVLCCHGTPYSIDEGIYQNQPFSPAFAKQLSDEKVELVLSGHTHIHADFVRNGIRFINPGAVGYSFDGDIRASYALLSLSDGSVQCKIRRVEYDIKRYQMEVEHAMEGFKLLDRLQYALTYGKPKNYER